MTLHYHTLIVPCHWHSGNPPVPALHPDTHQASPRCLHPTPHNNAGVYLTSRTTAPGSHCCTADTVMQCSPPCRYRGATLARHHHTRSFFPLRARVQFLLQHQKATFYYMFWHDPRVHITPSSLALPRQNDLAPLPAMGNIGDPIHGPRISVTTTWTRQLPITHRIGRRS